MIYSGHYYFLLLMHGLCCSISRSAFSRTGYSLSYFSH